MNYVLVKEEKIGISNFAFLYDKANERVFQAFVQAESCYKMDYRECARNIRFAYEAFVLHEEAKRRSMMNPTDSIENIREAVKKDIVERNTDYKKLLYSLCEERIEDFKPMIREFFQQRTDWKEDSFYISQFIKFNRYVYAFGSNSAHAGGEEEEELAATRSNCNRVLVALHGLLTRYYGVEKKYDSLMIPVREFIPISKRMSEKWGLTLNKGKQLYLREQNGKVRYYLFSTITGEMSPDRQRDVETLKNLWEENYDDPSNILRKIMNLSGENSDYCYEVYELPGFPETLSEELLKTLSLEQKLQIIKGLCQGIHSMHTYEPPYYHRNISPDAFYLFRIKGKYKPLLANFECVKDTAEDVKYTVLENVKKNKDNLKNSYFYSPSEMNEETDWEKEDVFSLGRLCVYILLGEYIYDRDVIMTELLELGVKDEVVLQITSMMEENACNRTSVEELLRQMKSL